MKKITHYIPLQLCVFLTLGILIGYKNTIAISAVFAVIIGSFLLLFFLFQYSKNRLQTNRLFQITTYGIIFLMGLLRIGLQDFKQQSTHYSHQIKNDNTLIYQITHQLKSTSFQNKYYAEVLQIDSTKCSGKLLVNITKDSLYNKPTIGSIYLSKTKIQVPNQPLNPYTFNYADYLKNKGVSNQIHIDYNNLKNINYKAKTKIQIIAETWRKRIQKKLEKYPFGKNELGIINALILGQKQTISKELLESYAGAGAIHILAVSGLHIGIIFLLLNLLLKPVAERIRYGNILKTMLIILLLFGFALLTGLSGSVVRAVSMFSFIAVGMGFKNRENGIFYALITSYFFLVLIKPLYLFDVGFQMSYAAVLGIVLLQPKINSFFPDFRLWLPKKIIQLLSVSIAATLSTLPLSLYYFHQFPGLFFLSNIIIIPFLGIIMSVGLFVVFLAIFELLPNWLVILYNEVLHLMNDFIEWVASNEQFLFKNISFSFAMLLTGYIIIITAYFWWQTKKPKSLFAFLLSIILLQSIFIYEKRQAQKLDALVIFHKTKETIIGIKQGEKLALYTSKDSIERLKFLQTYKMVSKIKKDTCVDNIPNYIRFKNKNILIVDSLGVYQTTFDTDIILMRQSPKINLERLLQTKKPKLIIADASNYKSTVKQWQKTCKIHKTDFYYTGTSGAYILQ